jgi:Zn-dependent peptidase ImmA (M78 family)
VVKGFKTWADKKSIELRKIMGLKSHDPIDCYELSEMLNIPVFTLKDLSILGFDNSHYLKLKNRNSDFFACILETQSGMMIINNHNTSNNRSNSNIVHEISHVICGHDFSSISTLNGSVFREFKKEQEDEANWLGGCLLLPRDGLVWASKKGFTVKEIAVHFGASEQMAKWRFQITGVSRQVGYYVKRQ